MRTYPIRVAAANYAKRYGDPWISLYMLYSELKTILLSRFHRRLEAELSVTVPGRTLETVSGMNPPNPVEIENIIAGREASHQTGRSIRERNKINTFQYVFRNSYM